MNFKKTALVLAMAGIVAAPMAAQASAGDGAYASIRIGLQVVEKDGGEGAGGTDSTTIGGYASRFGIKGETDLGNGMTGFGQYQFAVDTDGTDATLGNRLAYAGIKGDLGAVSVGREYATFYDHVVGVNDMPWAGSGYAMVAYRGRQSNGLSYAGGAGAVSYGVTLQMDGSGQDSQGDQETMDAIELGLSFDAGFGKFGFGYLDQKGDKSDNSVAAVAGTPETGSVAGGDLVLATLGTAAVANTNPTSDPDPIVALALSGIAAGPVTLGFGYQTQDVVNTNRTQTSFLVDALLGGGYLHYETLDADKANGVDDKTSLAIGYTKSLGPQTSAWIEYHDVNTDTLTGSAGDSNELRAILKYDI